MERSYSLGEQTCEDKFNTGRRNGQTTKGTLHEWHTPVVHTLWFYRQHGHEETDPDMPVGVWYIFFIFQT